MSNIGKWNGNYVGIQEPYPYGDTVTYKLGAEFLKGCRTVEDWGCGAGWFKKYLPEKTRYIGLEGSQSPFATKIVDLERYRSRVSGIYMRHVLEHNYEWQKVLRGALASFTKRFVLVTFTPFVDSTRVGGLHPDNIPDYFFNKEDITSYFYDMKWKDETYKTATQYGTETIFYVEK